MNKEVLFASLVSTGWILISFVFFAVCYYLLGEIIGQFRLMQLEKAWGEIEYVRGLTVSRLSLFALGLFMFLANVPINYYWMRRVNAQDR